MTSNPAGNPGGTTTSPGGTTISSGGTTKVSGGTTSNPGGTPATQAARRLRPAAQPLRRQHGFKRREHRQHGQPSWVVADLGLGVTSVNWHGCVWTGVDCKSNCSAGIVAVPSSTTSITPLDFTAATKEGGPYEVTGTVFNDYNSVALLGFDLTDTAKGDATQCSNAKRNPAADGPPAIAMPSGTTGFAINWSAKIAPVTSFRIQIQGVKGATDPTNRWCATITDASGPSFVKYSDFYPFVLVRGRRWPESRHGVRWPAHRLCGLPRAWHDRRESAVRFHNRWLRARHQRRNGTWSGWGMRHNDWHGRLHHAIVWPGVD